MLLADREDLDHCRLGALAARGNVQPAEISGEEAGARALASGDTRKLLVVTGVLLLESGNRAFTTSRINPSARRVEEDVVTITDRSDFVDDFAAGGVED